MTEVLQLEQCSLQLIERDALFGLEQRNHNPRVGGSSPFCAAKIQLKNPRKLRFPAHLVIEDEGSLTLSTGLADSINPHSLIANLMQCLRVFGFSAKKQTF